MTRRFHLSNSRELKLELPQGLSKISGSKPAGFWYDVNLDWLRWLDNEGYLNPGDKDWLRPYLHEVWVAESRLLKLGSAPDLDDFSRVFEAEHSALAYHKEIAWDKVRARHGGLEVSPYLWSRRLTPHTFWYYCWDCASGVVWEPSAILKTELVVLGKTEIIKYYRQHHHEEATA